SSTEAIRATLRRQRLFVEEALRAASDGVSLTRRAFRRAFAGSEAPGEQLLLWSLLERPSASTSPDALPALHEALVHAEDLVAAGAAAGTPTKEAALDAFLNGLPLSARTIVFTEHADTARALFASLRRRRRVLAVTGTEAWA